MDRRMERQMDEWMDGRTDVAIMSPLFKGKSRGQESRHTYL